jgi:hypothetical protein
MLNFYRQFVSHAAENQSPTHDALSRPRVKGSRPNTWTPELLKAFKECKPSLPNATLLRTRLIHTVCTLTDASTSVMTAVLQQRVQNAWRPLAFYAKKLNPSQHKYSMYERELLTID